MTDDYRVDGRSAKDIAAITLAWRDTLGIAEQWAPSVVGLLEISVPKVIKDFALVVRPDPEMGDAEAYTEFDPPHIAVRGSVYAMARRQDGRSRMTFAHELGHLVMHPGAAKLRSAEALLKATTTIRIFESAEWQARKFASLFLVPDHIAIQFNSAEELAECCKISAQAAQIRFNETAPLRKLKPIPDCVSSTIRALNATTSAD
ncbi:ImmA/IrrE family metallo-endopeptidase [Bradyrhizobium sp. AUGA SZCCT0169]|uniref:ImmA/IrrE family metallo-endopeptidase n=1 Tax=Bradyrhizobium sp. AUGA SZCCT0169 TaxID=2807663 RepID=UPI001BA5BE60|nr:ImmA/IrrE family metallo-endopeptidase [Bradyrhizobium sp. AUGA SZCCT0169]MBR1247082.1 ImmA/IrrE family metallo-endopeptidase [Bradyrhizobium sp. AUGA SZCCT0169]